jgi:hypothetical protein
MCGRRVLATEVPNEQNRKIEKQGAQPEEAGRRRTAKAKHAAPTIAQSRSKRNSAETRDRKRVQPIARLSTRSRSARRTPNA